MQFNLKNYQNLVIKNTLKKKNLLFFTININKDSQNWLTIEQSLHKLGLTYAKTYNNIAIKILERSIFRNIKNLISSTFFILKQQKNLIIKNTIINSLGSIDFTTLMLKLNKNIYIKPQLNTMNSYHYKKNISIMYQFLIITLKSPIFSKQKTRNNVI